MKKCLLFVVMLVLSACASKKKLTIEDVAPKKAELLCTVDDRVVLLRSAFNYAVEDNELDSIYRFLTKSYYYNVRKKFNPLKNHDLVNFIATHDYVGVDLPAIALCFEPETYKVKDNIDMDVLKYKFGKYYTHLDTLSVLLKDYHDKAEAYQVILPPLDLTSINTGFVNDSLDYKLKKFFKKKLKHRTVLYLDPLNNYVSTPIGFLKNNSFNDYVLVGYHYNSNLDESIEDFNFDYKKYYNSILAGMLAAVTEPLYRKHTSKKFENDLNDPAKHTSKYYPEELLLYAVMRKFKEYYNYPNPDPKSYLHKYDSTFQDVYNLFADYDPENTSNFNAIYTNAFNQLKDNFYNQIDE